MAKNKTIVTYSKSGEEEVEDTGSEAIQNEMQETTAEQQDDKVEQEVQAAAEPAAEETTAAQEPVATVATEEVAEQAPADAEPVATETSEPAQTPAEPMQDTAEQPAEEEPAVDAWTQKIETLKAKGSAMERMVVQTLEEYVTKMRPGNIMSVSEINQQQLQLWRIIKLVIESADGFATCYPLIIAYARQYKDACFHDRLLYRGMEHITLDKDTTTYYLGSLNVIKLAATSKSKKEALAQVDLNRVMNEHVFSDDGRNRVIQYFNR